MVIVQGGVMEERNLPAERVAAARRRQLRRRAKRGVVAGYIHELSVRHRHGGAPEPERRDATLATLGAPEIGEIGLG
jgi:hypothetical protein